MKCQFCHREIEDDSIYCEFCGGKQEFIDDVEPKVENVEVKEAIDYDREDSVIENKIDNKFKDKISIALKKRNVLIGISAIALLIVLVSGYFVLGTKNIELSQYVNQEIVFEGYNGKGYLYKSDLFDSRAFKSDLYELKGLSDNNESMEDFSTSLKKAMEVEKEIDTLEDNIGYKYQVNGNEVDELEDLSNGDKILVDITYDGGKNDYFGIRLNDCSQEYVVSGLKENNVLNNDYENNSQQNQLSQGDYILPDSSSRLLTKEDVRFLNKDTIRLAINEMYARYGCVFTKEDVRNYFLSKPWYREGTTKALDFKLDSFTSIERQNMELLLSYEEELKH